MSKSVPWTRIDEQRKVCKEYEITMDEDLEEKFKEFKQRDEEWARLKKGPMGTVDIHVEEFEDSANGVA